MHLSSVLSALALLGTAASAAIQPEKRAVTAQQLTANIKTLTQMSQDLQPVASSIQSGNTIIAKRQSNPFNPVIDGLQGIVRTTYGDIQDMDGTGEFPAADAQPVCDAFSDFVAVHQELLKIIIGKSGLLEGIFLGPVAAVLRSLEEAVDTLAFGVIDSVPSCQADATKQKDSLDDTLGKAVCAYTPTGSLGLNLFC